MASCIPNSCPTSYTIRHTQLISVPVKQKLGTDKERTVNKTPDYSVLKEINREISFGLITSPLKIKNCLLICNILFILFLFYVKTNGRDARSQFVALICFLRYV